jgi:SAM-dependent methyltransferase
MTAPREGGDHAKRAYEDLAPSYDDYAEVFGYEYGQWTATLVAKAEELGLEGDRLLDVGCGTGLSFIPMLERGWRATGCDISPEMLAVARGKVGDRAELVAADMRDLPRLGEFDLVWAVNNPLNYLRDGGELRAALAGMRRNLAPQGMAAFDLVTLRTARAFIGEESVVKSGRAKFTWRRQVRPEEVVPGSVATSRLLVDGDPARSHVHRFRHFPEAEILAAIEAVGLRLVSALGERNGELEPGLDEEAHSQAVYFCRA